MILNNSNSHVQGIFKYSDDVFFERGDFVVDGDCIYVCTATDPNGVRGQKPSLDKHHEYYSEYPGNKIYDSSEYYDYLRSLENVGSEYVEDKYISAHSLCQILNDMYFGFGDNGILYDHIIYNPNGTIDYSVRDVREQLDYSDTNVLNKVLQTNDLNNGLLKVSRNLPEISNIIFSDSSLDSDVVILKQYTYLNSENSIPFRVQELMDPENNNLYYRFAEGDIINGELDFSNSIATSWRGLYGSDQSVMDKLNSLSDFYLSKIEEEQNKVSRLTHKFCYREVERTDENGLSTSYVQLRPGGTRDIKSMEDFRLPCLINIIVKTVSTSNISRNYTTTIDLSDVADLGHEVYSISDDIELDCSFNDNVSGVQVIYISTNAGIIKNIYYRDNTLNHQHDWVLDDINYPYQEATCTTDGTATYVCDECHAVKTEVTPAHHTFQDEEYRAENCGKFGQLEHKVCTVCGAIFEEDGITETTQDNVTLYPTGHHTLGGILDEVLIEPTYPDYPNTHHGLGLKTCEECGNKIEVLIPYKQHSFRDPAMRSPYCTDSTHHYPESVCGHTIYRSDEPDPDIIYYNYRWAEFDSNGNEIPIERELQNHTVPHIIIDDRSQGSDIILNSNYTPATCDEYGYWTGTCTLCGENNAKEYNWNDPPTGHRITDLSSSIYTHNDCTHDAKYTGTCDICHESSVEMIDNGHLRIGHVDRDLDNVCDVCGDSLVPQNNE